jgi:uncharacterized membrane protein YhhN
MTKSPFQHLLFGLLFFLLVALDIYFGSTSYIFFRVVSKPLILLSLIFYFLQNRSGMKQSLSLYTLLALVFSLMGDVFLLFDQLSEAFFVLGLGSFLLAHICYAFCFYLQSNSKIRLDFWVMTLLLSSYGVALYVVLYIHLGNIKIPVAIYILAILIMVITAYKRKGNVSDNGFLMVFIGALSFIISDSLLAINKFLIPLPYSNFLVMGTYATAQYLIIRGLIKDINGNTD